MHRGVAWENLRRLPQQALPSTAMVLAVTPLADLYSMNTVTQVAAQGLRVAVIEVAAESVAAAGADARRAPRVRDVAARARGEPRPVPRPRRADRRVGRPRAPGPRGRGGGGIPAVRTTPYGLRVGVAPFLVAAAIGGANAWAGLDTPGTAGDATAVFVLTLLASLVAAACVSSGVRTGQAPRPGRRPAADRGHLRGDRGRPPRRPADRRAGRGRPARRWPTSATASWTGRRSCRRRPARGRGG